jgi:hypothetical protein
MSILFGYAWIIVIAALDSDTFPLPRPYSWVIVHSQILLLAVGLHKNWLHGRTGHFWYMFIMAQSLFVHIYWINPSSRGIYWFFAKVMNLVRLGLCNMVGDFRMHAFVSLLHTALCFGIFWQIHWTRAALFELLLLCVVLAYGAISISGSWKKAVEHVDAEETKHEKAASFELLRVVCDAVVELDSQQVITSAATDLGALLLRGANKSLKGVSFRSLLALEADRLMFDSRVGAFETPAGAMNVRIADSLSTLLRLQLLYVRFSGADGRIRYFIGIRENVDTLDEFRAGAKGDKTRDRCRGNAVDPSYIVAVACALEGASPTSETHNEGSSSGQESVSNTSGSASSNSGAEQVSAEAMSIGRPRLSRRKRVERKRHSRRSSYEQTLAARSAALFGFGDDGSSRIDKKEDVTTTEGSEFVESTAIAETADGVEVAPSSQLNL